MILIGVIDINIRQRQTKILDYLSENKDVSVNDLIQLIPASPATIRRDLTSLSNDGLIVRSHGYVHKVENNNSPILPLVNRTSIASAEKTRIAEHCSHFVKSGMNVLLDSGSTCLAIAEKIKGKDISIVTNSVEICTIMQSTITKIICTGGIMDNQHLCFLGKDANAFIKNIEVDIAFIGATGIRANRGFTTSSPLQYDFKRCLINSSQQKYIVFDSSKFYSANIYLFATFQDNISGIITNSTDDKIAVEQLAKMQKDGLNVITV